MQTNYPWEGVVKIKLDPKQKAKFDLHIRLPGWSKGNPVPGDLYTFKNFTARPPVVRLNGKDAVWTEQNGYIVMNRTWQKGDVVEVIFEMPVNELLAHPEVKQNHDRLALQRGPLVYCVEGADNNGKAWNFVVDNVANYQPVFKKDLLGGIMTIQFNATCITGEGNGAEVKKLSHQVVAIPYFAWNNRGANKMQVWLPTNVREVIINPDN